MVDVSACTEFNCDSDWECNRRVRIVVCFVVGVLVKAVVVANDVGSVHGGRYRKVALFLPSATTMSNEWTCSMVMHNQKRYQSSSSSGCPPSGRRRLERIIFVCVPKEADVKGKKGCHQPRFVSGVLNISGDG